MNKDGSQKCSFCKKSTTNLQCSKTGCENYICPSCLEQTPVGARCPKCAKMKKNPLYDPSKKELVISTFAGISVSIFLGVILSLFTNLLGKILPLRFIILIIPVIIGYLIGITIERTSKFKKSNSLQIIAGFSVLIGFVVYNNTLINYLQINSISSIVGLLLGLYIAISKVRP